MIEIFINEKVVSLSLVGTPSEIPMKPRFYTIATGKASKTLSIDVVLRLDGEYDDYYDENPETLTVSKSWGKKVSAYYGTDYVKKGKTKIEAEDLQDEEEEAAMAHKRAHMSQLHEDDFGLEEIVAKTISDKSEETPDALVVPTYATIEEKVANLKLRSPELETMIDEFNQINEDLEKHVKPKLLKIGRIVGSRTLTNEQKLVQLKFSVYSHYLMCLSCYFMFKLRKENTDNHPVTEKLLEYRKFMTKIDKIEKSLEKQKRDKPQSKFKANASGLNEISETPHFENDHLELYEKLKKYQEAKKLINLEARQKAIDDEKAAAEEVKRKFERNMGPKDLIVEKDGVSKRKASKAVKSNRSIFEMRALAYKKTKNPRTKNRKKSEVAVVKRRGQVRDLKEVRERYSGEASGINVHTIRGTKLK